MVLSSCRSVSPPAPGFPNSSGTSVSATDQRIPRFRSHTRRSAQPTAAPQTTGPLFSTCLWLTFIIIFGPQPLQLTYHGSFLQGSKTRRTSQKSSHILPSPKAPLWTGSPAPKAHHWAGQAAWTRPQGPTQGTGNESRPLLLKLLPVTLDPHTDASRSVAGHVRASSYLRLSSGHTVPLKGPDKLLRVPRHYLVSKTYFLARLG